MKRELKLANNMVRINGYKGDKKSHVDVEVRMEKVEWVSGGKHFVEYAPRIDGDRAFDIGIENGLDAVTSYNYWNFVGKHRLTERVL